MSTFQRLTLIGLYAEDPSLFDAVTLPEGYDGDTFRDTLLLEHGEKCVLYTDPVFFKFSLGAVSRKWSLELSRIYEALTAEYNPIYNYDRFEDWEDHAGKTHGEKITADYTNSRTANLQDKTTNGTTDTTTHGTTDTTIHGTTDKMTYNSTDTTSQTTDGTTERQVAAFNSSTYEPSEKTTTNNGIGDTKKTGDDTRTISGNDTRTLTGNDTLTRTGTTTVDTTGTDSVNTKGTLEEHSGSDKENSNHKGHLYGNIGVTTSAQMVSEVVDQRLEKNLYEIAARIFANELLIQIY